MKKKLLSLLMVLCLTVAMAPAVFADNSAETSAPWDGSTMTAIPENGEITTAEQLAWLSDQVNNQNNSFEGKTLVLKKNIDLGGKDFTPIGGKAYKLSTTFSGNSFKGTFDGGNLTITNGKIKSGSDIYNMGLFGFVNGGTIRNLTVTHVTVNNDKTENEAATAIVVAAIYDGTIENVTVGEGCTVTGKNRVGGVVGSVRNECTISNCTNNATVNGSGMYTGGVIGAAHDLKTKLFSSVVTPATITSCINSGTITGVSEVGGIVGYSDQATITSCTNESSVTATSNYGCGGIIGFDAYNPRKLVYTPANGSNVTGCTNSGAINGPRSGGIVGTLGVTPGQDQPTTAKVLTKISNCTNSGDVTGTTGKFGAIFGYQITYKSGDADNAIKNLIVKISDCTNTGSPETLTPSTFIEE